MAWPWNRGYGSFKLVEMAPFNRSYTTYYWSVIVNTALSCIIYEIMWDIGRKSRLFHTSPMLSTPVRRRPSGYCDLVRENSNSVATLWWKKVWGSGMWQRDRQSDGRTDRHLVTAVRAMQNVNVMPSVRNTVCNSRLSTIFTWWLYWRTVTILWNSTELDNSTSISVLTVLEDERLRDVAVIQRYDLQLW